MTVDDFASIVLAVQNFLEIQGFAVGARILKDNQRTILLETKGISTVGKCWGHISIRFYVINGHVVCDKAIFEFLRIKDMVADFLTNPQQDKLFQDFRNLILGQNQ